MITLRKFIETINFKINECINYGWNCYGPCAMILDCEKQTGIASVVFDLKNQIVYEITCCDYNKNEAYKWISPKYKKRHDEEMKKRKIIEDQAWDSVIYKQVGSGEILELVRKIARKK